MASTALHLEHTASVIGSQASRLSGSARKWLSRAVRIVMAGVLGEDEPRQNEQEG